MLRIRFHLRSVMILVTFVGLVLAPMAARIARARREAAIAADLGNRFESRIGFDADYDPQLQDAFDRWWWPRDKKVYSVCLAAAPALPLTDSDVVQIGKLDRLQYLTLMGRLQLTDAALIPIGRLSHLKSLHLGGAGISDAGMANLARLHDLESLQLHDTAITDASLLHLEGMTKLRELNLYGARVTADGVKRLQAKLPDCEIDSDVN
jgi:hypothetical protein